MIIMDYKKILLCLITISLIFVCGCTTYDQQGSSQVSPKSDVVVVKEATIDSSSIVVEAEDWNQYINKNDSFSIVYPKDWKITTELADNMFGEEKDTYGYLYYDDVVHVTAPNEKSYIILFGKNISEFVEYIDNVKIDEVSYSTLILAIMDSEDENRTITKVGIDKNDYKVNDIVAKKIPFNMTSNGMNYQSEAWILMNEKSIYVEMYYTDNTNDNAESDLKTAKKIMYSFKITE